MGRKRNGLKFLDSERRGEVAVMTVWFIGYLVVMGALMAEDDDDLKWWHFFVLFPLWPFVVGAFCNRLSKYYDVNSGKGGGS